MSAQRFPDGNAYVEAIQNTDNLKDADLLTGSYERRANGLPKPYSGGFTTTFNFKTPSGHYAVRCFTRGSTDLERRYHAITEFLRLVRNAAFCQATYLTDGIRVDGRWWPIIKMVWVNGRQLNNEVEAQLGNSAGLIDLATKFRTIVRELGVLGVAHGDLQHGNIIVTEGTLRLIDYDGIYLPALHGMKASEFGHQNYQHPGRGSAPFDGRLDRFSSIVIYTALVALAADPSLWQRFNNDENILFRATDFTSNGRSDLFVALLNIPATRQLATNLIELCRIPCEQVVNLEQAIQSLIATESSMPPTTTQLQGVNTGDAATSRATPFTTSNTSQQQSAQASTVARGARVWTDGPRPVTPPIPPQQVLQQPPVFPTSPPTLVPSANSSFGTPTPPGFTSQRRQPKYNYVLPVILVLALLIGLPGIIVLTYLGIKASASKPVAIATQTPQVPATTTIPSQTPAPSVTKLVATNESGSCSSPTPGDVVGMTAAIEGFHRNVSIHDFVSATYYENQVTYQSEDALQQGYRTTVSSQPIILNITGCSVRVALRFRDQGQPEMCLEQRYDMEYLSEARPRWIIHDAHSNGQPLQCA